jgi:hypothetical protein
MCEAKRRALKSPALLYTVAETGTARVGARKRGITMSAIYDELRLEDLSPEEKLRGEAPSDIEVPGIQKPESVEVKRELNPNTE